MHSVLPKWRDSLLSTSQSEQLSNAVPSFIEIASGLRSENRITVSSAYKMSLQSYPCHLHNIKIKEDLRYTLQDLNQTIFYPDTLSEIFLIDMKPVGLDMLFSFPHRKV